MEYSINFVNIDRELSVGHYKASVVYTFTISNGLADIHGDLVLTDRSKKGRRRIAKGFRH